MPLAGSWPRGFALGRFFSMIIMMMIMMILLMMMLIIIRGLAAAVDQKGDSVQLLGLAQGGKVEALGQVVDTGICEIHHPPTSHHDHHHHQDQNHHHDRQVVEGGFIVAGASIPSPPKPAFVAFVN